MSPVRTPALFTHVAKGLIIVPALYLTLLHCPSGRLFALVALGRNQGSVLASAMEGDRGDRREMGFKRSGKSDRRLLA
jgi:hypothetical protein